MPNSEQVKLIFKETYLFYTKWISVTDPDWDRLMQEARELNEKYPYNLCRQIILELVEIIEDRFMERK